MLERLPDIAHNLIQKIAFFVSVIVCRFDVGIAERDFLVRRAAATGAA